MDHKTMNRLYNDGEIVVRSFAREFDEYGNKEVIEAFEYDGKFYLRLHLFKRYGSNRVRGKFYVLYHSPLFSSYIKEFDTKERANNYYKKVTVGKGFKEVK